MQAPEGAILAFDRPINLQKLELDGKITGGRLVGDIRIFSAGGPNSDDLELVTSNVQISDKRIYTRDRVAFRLGNNFGTGRELTLTRDESKSEPRASRDKDGLHEDDQSELLSQLALVELHRLETLTVQLEDDSLFRSFAANGLPRPTDPSRRAQGVPDPDATAKSPVNVKLECAGPLRFDLKQQIATVEKNVVLTHQVRQQPANELRAEQLSLHFARRPADQRIDGKGNATSKMALNRIVAFGSPMMVNAASENAYVETKHLEYNFASERVKLRANNPFAPDAQLDVSSRVIIRNAEHQIAAPAIDILVSKDQSKTQIIAQGAGEYVGRIEASSVGRRSVAHSGFAGQDKSREATSISATWLHRLSLQPYEDQQVLKVEGNATVRAGEFGQVRADTFDLWLKQKQIATKIDGTPVLETTPTRLVTHSASGRPTEIASPQLSGNIQSMTLHFVESTRKTSVESNQPFGGTNGTRGNLGLGSQDPNRPANAYQVEGGDVTAWVDITNEHVQRLVVQGQTRLLESTDANAKPTEIKGTSIDVRIDPQGRPIVELAGAPAEFKSQKMELSGANIELRGDENRLVVPGGGTLRVAFDPTSVSGAFGTNASAQKIPNPRQVEPKAETQVEIQWTDELRFDGQTALLLGEVTVLGDDLAVRTNDLDIVFQDRIDFAKLDSKTIPKVATLTAKQAVMAGTRQRNEAGSVESYQQLVTQNLSVNFQSGELLANGPGWIAITTTPDKLPSSLSGSPENSTGNELRQLSLTFAQQLRGNLLGRNFGMFDNIQGWMGPVARWEDRVDPTEVAELGEGQYRLSCNQLSVFESPTAPPLNPRDPKSRKPFEMIADQGAHVEGQLYFARGERITFVEEKGVLAMRGSNKRMAEFWQRNSPNERGALSGKARVIQYNVKTKKMDARVSDLELDLSQNQNGDRKSGVSMASHQSGRLITPTRRSP